MRAMSVLVKPASSACTMRCAYCFYRDVAGRRSDAPSVMDEATVDALIDGVLAAGDDASVSFDFQGGEPTLAGLDFFKDFVAKVRSRAGRQRVSYAIQTNGLAVDDEWAAFLAENRFLVGVSLDGWRGLHDRLRPDAAGRPTYDRVVGAVGLLRRFGIEPALLTVLTCELARHPQRAWRALGDLQARYVQFIPCVADLDGRGPHALTPDRFASFYRGLLDAWERDLERRRYVSVGLFDDVMSLARQVRPRTCGALGACAPQFVVEASGDVYPCDFYCLEENALGNVRETGFVDMARSPRLEAFLRARAERPGACDACRFEGMCHGGCRRLSSAFARGDECGYRDFLEYGFDRLARLAVRPVRR